MLPLDRMLDVQLLIKDKSTYKTANIFGVIAYTDQNPYVIKVLQDEVFWNSLNARTKGWILYAIKPNSNYYKGGNAGFINNSLGVKPDDLPQLILLSIGSNQTMMQRNYPIAGDSIESTYNSIAKTIDIITTSVEGILPDYKSATSVHREAVKALDAELATKRWKRVSYEFIKLVAESFL